uniref:Lipocalin n=1 Tax=Rhipicephalus appendiculatus TaxID=34631 RepID=A0A131YH23_RHIAP
MVQEQLCKIVLIFASIALVNGLFTCGMSNRCTPDIRQFVCTNERVWTYSTSTSEYVRCKVDQVTSICRAAILFRRYYFYDETQ